MLCRFVDYFYYNWETKRGAEKGKKKYVAEQEENETVSSDDDSDHESELNILKYL